MQRLIPMKIIVVPGWIQRALIRNKLQMPEILNFAKVRPVLSLDDMTQWFYMNDSLKLDNCRLSNTMIESMWSNCDQAGKDELYRSVLPLATSAQVAKEVTDTLNVKSDSSTNPVTVQPFQFVRIEHILYIVLSEGFMASMLDEDSKKDFVKKYLKECYAMASVSEVSKLDMFKLYLQHIA